MAGKDKEESTLHTILMKEEEATSSRKYKKIILLLILESSHVLIGASLRNSRRFATSRQIMSEKRAQKFYTDDASLNLDLG